jgi:hypothetical protein
MLYKISQHHSFPTQNNPLTAPGSTGVKLVLKKQQGEYDELDEIENEETITETKPISNSLDEV